MTILNRLGGGDYTGDQEVGLGGDFDRLEADLPNYDEIQNLTLDIRRRVEKAALQVRDEVLIELGIDPQNVDEAEIDLLTQGVVKMVTAVVASRVFGLLASQNTLLVDQRMIEDTVEASLEEAFSPLVVEDNSSGTDGAAVA